MTATLPDQVPHRLPLNDAGSDEWHYWGQSLGHNKEQTNFPHLPSLHGLSSGKRVGLLVSESGQLNLYMEQAFSETIASDLPTHTLLYGVVDVFGSCSKIKSELLSGELDGVCMDVYSS